MQLKCLALFFFAIASLSATPKAIIFDFGGVLVSTDKTIAANFLCNTLCLTVNDLKQAKLKRPLKNVSEVEFWKEIAQEKGIALPCDWEKRFYQTMQRALGVNSEMFLLVDQLKEQHIRVGLLSNVEASWARLVRSFGLYAPFDPCLLSCDIGVDKPDPRAYHILLERLKLPPNEVVFIDDKPENIAAAKNAGIDGIVFTSAKQLKQALEQRGIKALSSGDLIHSTTVPRMTLHNTPRS